MADGGVTGVAGCHTCQGVVMERKDEGVGRTLETVEPPPPPPQAETDSVETKASAESAAVLKEESIEVMGRHQKSVEAAGDSLLKF